MRAALIALVVACGSRTPIVAPPEPPLAARGDWQASPSEPYKGKQDDIYFVTPKVGFYGNGTGKIFRTQDGGGSWQQVFVRSPDRR